MLGTGEAAVKAVASHLGLRTNRAKGAARDQSAFWNARIDFSRFSSGLPSIL